MTPTERAAVVAETEAAIVAWLLGLGYTAIMPGRYFAALIERGAYRGAK